MGFANQISTCTSIDTDVYMYIGSNVYIYNILFIYINVYIYICTMENDKLRFVLSVGFAT